MRLFTFLATFLLTFTLFGNDCSTKDCTFAQLRKGEDASVDRNILTSTAETTRAGKLSVTNYELAWTGLRYGIDEATEISGTLLMPMLEDMPLMGDLSLKRKLSESDSGIFSVKASLTHTTEGDLFYFDDDGMTVGTLTFLYDFILSEKTVITLAQSNMKYFGDDSYRSDAILMSFSVAISHKVNNFVKLMGELTAMGSYYDGEFEMEDDFYLFNYGVRFYQKNLSVDLAFIRPMLDYDDPFVLGIPYVSFSAQF